MIGRRDFFCSCPLCFFPYSRLSSYHLRLSLSYFVLAGPMREWLGKHSYMSSPCLTVTFLFSRAEIVCKLGRSFVYQIQIKLNLMPPFMHGPAFVRTALPRSDGLSHGEGWHAVAWCGWGKLKGAQPLKIKVQVPGRWAKECVFDDCVNIIWFDEGWLCEHNTSLMEDDCVIITPPWWRMIVLA